MIKPASKLALTALLATTLGGCPLFKDRDRDREQDAGAAATTAGATEGGTKVGSLEAAQAPPLPPGRTGVPTLAEWAAMREVTVKGSSALKCETKMVREYLRVSCRDRNDTGGTPTSVRVTKGGRDIHTFAAGGVTSAIIPYTEGIDAALVFSWTDKSHVLSLRWPKGAPKPVVLGTFEGAASPLDGASDAALNAKLCECHKKVTKQTNCYANFSMANVDCDLTFGNDCAKLLECSRGEPAAIPKCRPGYVLGPMNYCYKGCAGGAACPSGASCDPSFLGKPACLPN